VTTRGSRVLEFAGLPCIGLACVGMVLGCRTVQAPLPSTSAAAVSAAPAGAPEGRPEMIWPRRLAPGDTIAIVAPAGELEAERITLARERLEARGYKVVQRDDLFAHEGYLAGDDERRATELMQAFLDPEVDAIFPGTGGYGTMRILDRLDYRAIRQHPKLVIGFSDITGLHAALNRRAGLVTFHSPMAMAMGSPDGLKPFTERWFRRAVENESGAPGYRFEDEEPLPEGATPIGSFGRGRARGRLVGGNLSLISALEGTPYAIDTRGAILLLEDVREAPYRVDRMLKQLELSGKLKQLRGVVLAQFTRNYDREDEQRRADPRYTSDGVLAQYFENRGIPVLTNFPLGHVERNATLPLGGLVEIDADAKTLAVLGESTPWLDAPLTSGSGVAVAAAEWMVERRQVRPGLFRSTRRAGHPAPARRFQVKVGEFEKQADADALWASVEAAGFAARVGYAGGATGTYGIFLADSADRAAAESLVKRLRSSAFPKAEVVEVGQDLSSPTGPWVADVLEIDPSRFRMDVVHAADAALGVETTRSTARRLSAIAAVNGGYYVTRGLTRGDSAGYLRVDGELLSETDRHRASVGLLRDGDRTTALFGRLRVAGRVRLGAEDVQVVDGINRQRGDDEAIVYTPAFHRTTLTDAGGVEVVIRGGRVSAVRRGAGSTAIPPDGWVLSLGPDLAARGDVERFLPGAEASWSALTTSEPVDARWQRAEDVVSGGPWLLSGGRRVTDWSSEPFTRVFVEARHPRTALGVRADGTFLLVTVDGRQADWSVGMSLPELTDLLLDLGAVDAINLDGGGSTTMVVDGEVVNRPSDANGERENGDAVLVFEK
jgi:muramoyltetrapeptide carboxypeptidase